MPPAPQFGTRPFRARGKPAPEKGTVFNVQVEFEDGWYIATCEGAGLVTEAKTYKALVARVRLVAPDLAEANGLPEPLSFVFQPDPCA